MLSTMTFLGWPAWSPFVAAIKCLTGPGAKRGAWEETTQGKAGGEPEGNGEPVVKGEGEVAERRGWSGETVEPEHSPTVSATPIAPSTPADDTPPPEASPYNRQQPGFPSGRIDGEDIAPPPFSEAEGDAAV